MIVNTRVLNPGNFNKRIKIIKFESGFNDKGDWVESQESILTKAWAYIHVQQLNQVTENDTQIREGYTEMTIAQNRVTMQIETGMRVTLTEYGKEMRYKVDDIDYMPNDKQYLTLKCVKE